MHFLYYINTYYLDAIPVVMFFFPYFLSFIVLPLKLAAVDGLALEPLSIGYLFGMQAMINVAAALPVGRLADRFGADRMLPGAQIFWALAVAALPFADTFETMGFVMALNALATGM